jgi:uncharacterized membrane protein
MLHVIKSVTVNRPRQEVYEFWRDLERLPTFMIHLKAVTEREDRRSHWVVNAPGGLVEWDAEIIDDRAGEIISWQSLEGSDVPNGGSVRFTDAPADRGTEVHVDLHFVQASTQASGPRPAVISINVSLTLSTVS